MSKATFTSSFQASTDVAFRTWGSGVSNLFTTCGLTKASDTGQIDWTTVTRPAPGVIAGYEIWRLNDTFQASAPLFIKIEYGTSPDGTPYGWSIVHFGEGSNGSGSLTGAQKVNQQFFRLNGGGTSMDVWMNYNPTLGYFAFGTSNGINFQLSGGHSTYSFERLRNADGTPSGRGFAFVYCPNSGNPLYSTFTPGAMTAEGGPSIPAFWPWQFAGCASAGGTFVAGLTPCTGNGTFGPLEKTIGFLVCGYSDFSSGSVFQVTRWDGRLHTYLALPTTGASNQNAGSFPGAYTRHAVLWE